MDEISITGKSTVDKLNSVHKNLKNKSIAKVASITYLTPTEKEELEQELIDNYGPSASEHFPQAINVGSSHVTVSGRPVISIPVKTQLLTSMLGLWEVMGTFTVNKSDQIINEFVNGQPSGTYSPIESISDISSHMSGINSLFGLSIEWTHSGGSSEEHLKYADVYIDGQLSNSSPLIGSTSHKYISFSLSVAYMTPAELEALY